DVRAAVRARRAIADTGGISAKGQRSVDVDGRTTNPDRSLAGAAAGFIVDYATVKERVTGTEVVSSGEIKGTRAAFADATTRQIIHGKRDARIKIDARADRAGVDVVRRARTKVIDDIG